MTTIMYGNSHKMDTDPDKFIEHINPYCTENCWKNLNDGKLQCNCGIIGIYEWLFINNSNNSYNNEYNNNNIRTNNVLITSTQEIIFHPVYSSGTAVLRGEKPFKQNLHHYWEMKILSKLYGTDVMIGIGTTKTILEDSRYRFFSLLGFDDNSWGYSYNGIIQHGNIKRDYGLKFGIGSLIGCHLNMYNGTLEFFHNRKPMGVAFNGLKSYELHPMICSTAAQSSMKMTCSISIENSLQLLCLKCIIKYPMIYKQFKNIPGLIRVYETKYFWLISDDDVKRKVGTDVVSGNDNLMWKKRKISPPAIRWRDQVFHTIVASITGEDSDITPSSSSSSSAT